MNGLSGHFSLLYQLNQLTDSFAYASNEEAVNLVTLNRYGLEVGRGNWDTLPQICVCACVCVVYIYIHTHIAVDTEFAVCYKSYVIAQQSLIFSVHMVV